MFSINVHFEVLSVICRINYVEIVAQKLYNWIKPRNVI